MATISTNPIALMTRQALAAGLVALLLLAGGTAQAQDPIGNGIEGILGTMPDPTKVGFRSKVQSVVDSWLADCPIERDTTYYFSDDGDDANDGLTQGAPKQTIGAMNTLLSGSASGINIKIKAGSVYRTSTEIAARGNSISAYGTGEPPYISGFTQTISSGGSAWTNATGDRWTTTDISTVGWLREADLSNWSKVYKKATSTAEVEANELSWYETGGTVHINAGSGIDPNDIAWEASSTGGSDYDGIELSEDGGRVDGLILAGQNMREVLNQSYGIKCSVTGEAVACVTNCGLYYHPRHNGVHFTTSGAGGRTLMQNCKVGWVAEDDGFPIVSYNFSGGQDHISLQSQVLYGVVPKSVDRDSCEGRAWYAHSDGTEIGRIWLVDCTLGESDLGCDDFGTAANTGTTVSDITDCNFVAFRCSAPSAKDRKPVVGYTNHAYVCCDFTAKLATNVGAVEAFAQTGSCLGWFAASKYTMDFTDYPAAARRIGIINPPSNTNIQPVIASSHIHIIGNQDIEVFWYNRDQWAQATGTSSHSYNTLWTATNNDEVTDPGLGDGSGSTSTNNAFFGFYTGSPGAPNGPGYQTNWANTTELAAIPDVVANRISSLDGLGLKTAPLVPEVNLFGEPLVTPGDAIGPYGETPGLPYRDPHDVPHRLPYR